MKKLIFLSAILTGCATTQSNQMTAFSNITQTTSAVTTVMTVNPLWLITSEQVGTVLPIVYDKFKYMFTGVPSQEY